jgi:hypothetical protein
LQNETLTMTRSKDRPGYRSLLVSLLISGIMLAAGLALVPEIKAHQIIARLLWPLMRLMILITIGLLVGQIIEATGWTKALAIVARPMFRFGHLGNHCSAAFTTAFFSGVSSNAMLFDFLQEGKITRTQLYLTNFINQLPAFFLHLPTTFFIVMPLTGLAGGLYFLITFLAVVLRTVLFLVYGHFRLPAADVDEKAVPLSSEPTQARTFTAVWQRIASRLPGRILGITVYVVPIYVLVFVLNAMGLFKLLRDALTGFVVTNFMPMESLSVIVLSFAAEFTSGFAAAGALLQAGVLTVKQTVVALLLGNVLAFPIRALRHQLPRYIGIFSPKMGAQILFMGQGFRVLSIILVGLVYYCIA